MLRSAAFLVVALLSLPARADDVDGLPAHPDETTVPISISSPDTARTFVFGRIQSHALVWDKKTSTLVARVSVVDDSSEGEMQTETDTHDFRLPGVTFDAVHNLYVATSAKGEVIPVARPKKVLFLTSIEPLPNARVRIFHDHGELSVMLEAISPNDPAMHPKPAPADGDSSTRAVDIGSVLR